MDLALRGKRTLVTGASRGTGAAIAAALAREGATILVHGLEEGAADPVVAGIRADGGDATACWGDIATDKGATAAADQALANGAVDILVNNYGTAARGSWAEAGTADWLAMYEANVLSAARMARLVTPAMRAKGWGRVIQLGTVGSSRPAARMPHYYASKGALATMTVSLAKELAGTGITVNLVSPALIRTAEVEANLRARAERKGWGAEWARIETAALAESGGNLVGRICRPEEVGDLVAFLASPRADFITGMNIRIDGGAVDQVT